MEKQKRGRPKRREIIEMLDPEFRTGMLDGYAKAIQAMNQSKRDEILRRIVQKV